MRRWLLRILGAEKQIQDLRNSFNDLATLMDHHAVFKDSQGRSMGNYNEKEIERLWQRFYSIERDFVRASRRYL